MRIVTKNIKKEVAKIIEANAFGAFPLQQKKVQTILKGIAQEGDAALLRFVKNFDGVSLTVKELAVDPFEIELAHSNTAHDVLTSMRKAIKNITEYNLKQVPRSWSIPGPAGSEAGLRYAPIERVGVYVPGGGAPYFSTVLMNVIPAKVAGVKEIVLVTPPAVDGSMHKLILAAAKELGVTEIYKMGGAHAVAALALGTKTVKKVDKIVGPGNIYVTLAKQLVSGRVGIDKLAGPSDSVIIADRTVDPAVIAADLVTQAEHDVLASSLLFTDSRQVAEDVLQELEGLLKELTRAAVIRKSLATRGGIFVVGSLVEAVELANMIAPEHLELMVKEPRMLFNKVEHAGAVFMGAYAPEALGDYFAGPNHVLPTGGTARFSSPLGVMDFIRATSFLEYTKEGFASVAEDVERLARLEGFDGHASAIRVRKG